MNDNNTHDEEMPPQPQSRAPARQNWGRGVSVSSMVGVVAIVGVAALILFGLSLCSRPVVEGNPLAGTAGAGYGILERNVKAAFGNDTPADQGRTQESGNAASGSQQQESNNTPQNPQQQASPQEQQQQHAMQEEQEAMKTQEVLRDRQREQVPSILPENPPTPVPLGGSNY